MIDWGKAKRAAFLRAKERGKFYRTENEEGYIYLGKAWPTVIYGPTITGANFKGACSCATPPWEVCQHSFAA